MKGFTLIELLVVIILVAILAAAAIPLYRGKVDAAKWSEGRARIGTIATALRAYIVTEGAAAGATPAASELGFADGDLDGTYFTSGDFAWVVDNHEPMDFIITATAPSSIASPSKITLNATGEWHVTP